ncbi:unnamed protein product [Cyprideis torosa]|uniref:Probable deoxycytidylate deaminase n=1 Tax=Cyprideis torosa TaxID=163714 RepID=A0A7R8W925_9CRUS|nr:unnamed protein product [Cyprideis torosa]CAG0883864.1 unnamed protein product [Cyprideis torosa]
MSSVNNNNNPETTDISKDLWKLALSAGRPRENYLEWDEYFMAVACLSSMRSKDPASQVGACIVNQERLIVATGYNGMPVGCNDGELPWGKNSADELYNKYMYVCHAEMNAILNKNSADIRGSTIFVALFPCNECAKLIIQAGISKVIYLSDKHREKKSTIASKCLLDLAGIEYQRFIPKQRQIVVDFDAIEARLPSTDRGPMHDRE